MSSIINYPYRGQDARQAGSRRRIIGYLAGASLLAALAVGLDVPAGEPADWRLEAATAREQAHIHYNLGMVYEARANLAAARHHYAQAYRALPEHPAIQAKMQQMKLL